MFQTGIGFPFFRIYFNCLPPPLFKGSLIVGEDANITLDKTRPPGAQILKPTKLGTKFAKMLHDYDLVDIWGGFNATKHDYTYYSHVHLTYSQTDSLFTSATFLPLHMKV